MTILILLRNSFTLLLISKCAITVLWHNHLELPLKCEQCNLYNDAGFIHLPFVLNLGFWLISAYFTTQKVINHLLSYLLIIWIKKMNFFIHMTQKFHEFSD